MSYHTKTRDPLLETHMQAAIRKRGAELVGIFLLVIGAALSVALWTHAPSDPNWFIATAEPVQNRLGVVGAYISGTLMLLLGLASWCLPLVLIAYGIRLILHRGEERIVWRALAIPVFLLIAAFFFSSNASTATWDASNRYGLGGFAGDEVLSLLGSIIPIEQRGVLIPLTIILGLLTLWIGLFTMAFNWTETKRLIGAGVVSMILTYSGLLAILKRLFVFGSKGAVTAKNKLESHRERADGMPQIETEGRIPDEQRTRQQIGRKRLFPTLPVFGDGGNNTAPEVGLDDILVEDPETITEAARVKQRIQEAVQRKTVQTPEPLVASASQTDARVEPPIRRPNTVEIHHDYVGPANVFEDAGELEQVLEAAEQQALAPSPTPQPLPVQPAAKTTEEPFVKFPKRNGIKPSKRAQAEAQPNLFRENALADFELPALNLLSSPTSIVRHNLSDEALAENARLLENVLEDYGVKGEIVSVRPGPVVTMYELEPAPGLKASRVIGLSDDIARSMSALSARVSTVPGRSVIGIELPNDNRETVLLREILSSKGYGDGAQGLPLALGKDIGGTAEVADLAKMPHLLIAGTTGSGKSVAINTMILSLLYKLSPEECRLIMIDPKMLELSVYDGIPHLLSPVVTDPKKAVVALKWVVGEMEERYRKMSKMGVRNINGYNGRVADALAKGENFERTVQTGFAEETGEPIFETESFAPEKLPFIVVVVDEMADLMMVAGKEIEACIQRLAQMARASGIHLIMATQRPSVDVITGTIKANFPTRISFQVTSKIDSRTILGEMGAEQLLGMGDMLFMEGGGKITRIHAPFVSDEEVEMIVNHLKAYGPPEYVSGVVKGPDDEKSSNIDAVLGLGGNTDKENALYDEALAIVAQDRKCSTSYIQRKLSIGYNKAAKLVEEMEQNGVVSAANHVGKREILLPEQ